MIAFRQHARSVLLDATRLTVLVLHCSTMIVYVIKLSHLIINMITVSVDIVPTCEKPAHRYLSLLVNDISNG